MFIFKEISINTLIWLLPIVFMLHDFEEIILIVPWLENNFDYIRKKAPNFLERRIDKFANISTSQFALAVFLEFILFIIATFMAVEYGKFIFLIVLNSFLLIHGIMHIITVVILKRYAPFIITTILLIFPYCPYLFFRLLASDLITFKTILISSLVGVVLIIPIILLLHKISEVLYKNFIKLIKGD
ncbi:HXXEE domain-containing protein [Clostridium sp. D2Q-11]|uniref:HXXEE domain-containing protein n=1 Tax=Anaeromonas frigoriresistens TaxID=2683708 RepID=A0A942UVP3_9FIRM|nr:HXXEE domain-containing protein [Anaeromonas frigoriresistens]MBS4537286.1 HXXEE domain-containing protein [Anaeromonas frigoriresistens]